ncbi:MAG: methionine--tRNA ligase [Bacteroidia bacterium]|nr:methionine--tRNA ligase [Bacteroidia bacterium]MDW8158422.1 methionine--tRNA ligase [Bacteroidia bacterium]
MNYQHPKRYTVTAALPYANGPLHIGHLAGAYLPADIYVRLLRLLEQDVLFICGTDEHGVAITIRAMKEGLSPQEIIDKYHQLIKDTFAAFHISFDIFSRTSHPLHHQTAAEFFKHFYDKGLLIEKESEQLYDPQAQLFLPDRYVVGTCPKCGYDKAYGDQCESCGTALSPNELINPVSVLSGSQPILKSTKHWFFPLDKFQERLEDYILKQHSHWKPNVLGQCKSWLSEGLAPRAITRDLDWGVKVPLPQAQGKVLYVWFDAPIGYITATKEWAMYRAEQNAEYSPEDWVPYWKSSDTKLVHFIGKDNIVFHCIIFPAILMAHGEYIYADEVPANEFLNLEGEKISTSRNWAVWLHEYLQDFPGKTDVLRYVLCATLPETKDNNFTWEDFQNRNNNELVAILGNFVNRVLVLVHKYYQGVVPPLHSLESTDLELLQNVKTCGQRVVENILQFRFREALQEAMNLARAGNKYLAEVEPWHLITTQPQRVSTCLNIALQVVAALSIIFEPFLPETSQKIKQMLGVEKVRWLWKDLLCAELIQEGKQLASPVLLFEKIESNLIQKQIDKLRATSSLSLNNKEAVSVATASAAPLSCNPPKPIIQYDDFDKIDIRVATVLQAEKIKGADKLLKLTLDTGVDIRTVVSGIALYYTPEEIIGKQVIVLLNLAPRKLRGIESQGMILMAENSQGKLVFVQPSNTIENGAIVK